MALGGDLIKEYLVGLGFKVDEKSLSSFNKALDATKKSALSIVGVMAAAATGIVKFVDQMYKKDQQLEKDAKSMRKSVEQTRAYTNALQVMGVTAEQLKKDKSLRAIHKELEAIGMSMALPEGNEGIDTVKNLMQSFQKLKLTATYALDWINYKIKTVAAGPLKYFTDFMGRINMSFQANLPAISEWVAIGVKAVLSFIEVLFRLGEAAVKALSKIPKPILAIAAAIAALWVLIRAGPVGWITAAIMVIMLLLDDLFTYLDGGDALLGGFWAACIKWIGKIKEQFMKLKEPIQNIKKWLDELINKIKEKVDFGEAWENIKGIFSAIAEILSTIIGHIIDITTAAFGFADSSDTLTSIGTILQDVIVAALELIVQSIETFRGLLDALVLFLQGDFEGAWTKLKETGVATWDGIKDALQPLIDSITTALQPAIESIKGYLESARDDAGNIDWSALGQKIIDDIKAAFSAFGDKAGGVIKKLILGEEGAEADWSDVGNAIIDGIKSAFSTAGNFLKGLIMGEDNTEASWSEVGTTIWNGIKSGFTDVSSFLKGLFTGGDTDATWPEIGSDILSKITASVESVKEKGQEIALQLANFLNTPAALEGIEQIGDLAKNIASKFISSKEDWVEFVTTFIGDLGTALADGELIKTALGTAADFVSHVVTVLGEAVANSAETIGEVASALIGALGEKLGDSSIIESAITNAGDIIAAIATAVLSATEAIATAALDIATALLGALGEVNWAEAFTSAAAIATAIINGILEAIPGLTEAATGLVQAIVDLISGFDFAGVANSLADVALAIVNGIIDNFPETIESLGGLISAIGDGIIAAAEGLATAASTLVGRFVGFLLDPQNLLKIGEVGLQFVGALVKGVVNLGVSAIEGAAGVMTNAIVGFFRGVFGIKVDPYVEGMINDFMDKEFEVSDKFNDLGKAQGYALMGAMEATLSDTKSIDRAVEAWGIAVESGYSQFFPEFEHLGNESVISLYRGMATAMEAETPNAVQSAEAIALLVGLGYGEGLAESLEFSQPEVFAAYEELVTGNTINLEKLAAEQGYEIGDLLGVKIPEGYKMALIDGVPSLINTTDQVLMAAGQAVVAQGDNIKDLMSSMWDNAFDTSYSEISGWKDQLITLLEGMGIEAGDVLGTTLPEGIAEGLATGKITVEEAAAEIALTLQDKLTEAASDIEVDSTINVNPEVNVESPGDIELDEQPKLDVEPEITVDTESAKEAGKEAGEEVGESIGEGIIAAKPQATEKAAEVSEAVVEEFVQRLTNEEGYALGQAFGEGITEALQEAYDEVIATWEPFPEWLRKLFNTAKNKAVSAMRPIVGQMQAIANQVKNAFNDIPAHIGSVFDQAANNAISAFSRVASEVASQVAQINASISSINTATPNVGGGSSGKGGNTPMRNAAGGVYDSPVATTLAEDGEREYVIPTKRRDRAIPLVRALLSDLGLSEGNFKNASSILGGSPLQNMAPAYSQPYANTTTNNRESHTTVEAPVTVNVHGTDPGATANTIERVLERRLVHNVRGRLKTP